MSVRRITLRGYEVVVSETAPDVDADPVVLVHGIGVSSRYFAPLGRELGRYARVVAPDLPGFGGSPRRGDPLSIREHAEVVAALVEELGLERPLLVGHSMGAQVVVEVALRRPELVGGLVLLGPVVDPTARSTVRQALRLLLDTTREPPRGVLLQIREWLRTGVRWFVRTLGPMRDYPLEQHLPLLGVPVTLARGARDPVAPSGYLRDLATRTPDARLVEVPGTAHLVMYSRPEVIAALCRETVRRQPC
jgi:pimeloyl-ACP methyl ester carboxylesterase